MLSKEEERQVYNEEVGKSLHVYKLQAFIMIGKRCQS